MPELVPIRYGRMLVSPFTFYRGAAAIMAADLAKTPSSGLRVQLCGDAHLSNFGGFASPDRDLVFDINDFDETLPGPWEWDVKRLAASLAIAGRDRGFDDGQRRDIVTASAREYREAMRRFAQMRNLDVWYSRLDIGGLVERWGSSVSKRGMKRARKNVQKAYTKDSMRALSKLTRRVDGELRIVSDAAADRPGRRALPRAGGRGGGEGDSVPAAFLPPHAPGRRPRAAGGLPLRRPRAEGGRRRQRRHARPHRADARPRRPGPAVPAGQGGRGVGARAVRRARAATRTTVSASSRASG